MLRSQGINIKLQKDQGENNKDQSVNFLDVSKANQQVKDEKQTDSAREKRKIRNKIKHGLRSFYGMSKGNIDKFCRILDKVASRIFMPVI
jgi:hypothetical protein